MRGSNTYERCWRPAFHVVVSAFVIAFTVIVASPIAHAAAVTATLAVTSQWNTGFVANYKIVNSGSAQLADWKVEFDLPADESITNVWSSKLAQSGTHFVLTPEDYNRTIAPGGSISIGFQAALTGAYSPPANCLVNEEPCTTGSTPSTTTTTPTTTTPTTTTSTTGSATPGAATATLSVTSQWNTGFVANYNIANPGAAQLNDWKLEFDLPAGESITNAWNSNLAQSGTHYVLTPESYNSTIAPGNSVTVGFQAAQTGAYAPPANCLLNGQSCTGGSASTSQSSTPTTTTSATTSGTQICDQFGTMTIGGAYVVQNNRWGTSAAQCINVTATGFAITKEDGSAPTNGAPLSYPSVYLGCHYSNCSPGSRLPAQLSQLTSANSSVSYSYASGTYDAAYDIWLDPTPKKDGVNQMEIMIWFNRQGSIQPVGAQVGTATVGGRNWDVWQGSNGSNNVISYVAPTPINSWSFSVLDFVSDVRNRGTITNSWYLTSIQAGFEPWNGGVGLAVNSFSATVN